MPGQRSAHGRARGSWALRFAGIGFVVLLAGGATAGYLATSRSHPRKPAALPTAVTSEQAVGLFTAPAPGHGHTAGSWLLQPASGRLAFTPGSPASPPPGFPEWTADQMSGGGYIVIDITSGECLSAGPGQAPALRHCDLSRQQRWNRTQRGTSAGTQQYAELRNAASGRCLSVASPAATAPAASPAPAQLASCAADPSWAQLITFSSGF
jgi:hypothetical protein